MDSLENSQITQNTNSELYYKYTKAFMLVCNKYRDLLLK